MRHPIPFVALLLVWAGASRAGELPAVPTSPAMHRATVRLAVLTGFPDFGTLAVSVLTLRPLEVELGIAAVGGAHARAGPRLLLLDTGRRPNGVAIALSALAGVRLLTSHWGPNAVAAVDATYWFSSSLGLSLQVAGGAIYFRGSPFGPPQPGTAWELWPDVRVAFGAAF